MSEKTIWWFQDLLKFVAKIGLTALVITISIAEVIHLISKEVCR